MLLVVSVLSLVVSLVALCSITVWAGVSGRHWFLRGAVMVAVFGLLASMRAFQPMVWSMLWLPALAAIARFTYLRFQAVESSTQPAPLKSAGSVGESAAEGVDSTATSPSPKPFQFHLHDSLWAVVLFSAVFALMAYAFRQGVTWEWQQGVAFGVCLMIPAVCWALALRMRAPRGRNRWTILFFVLVLGLGALAGWLVPRLLATSVQFLSAQLSGSIGAVFFLSYVVALTVTFYLFTGWNVDNSAIRRSKRRALIALWGLVVFVPAGALMLAMLRPGPIPLSPYSDDRDSERLWQLVEELAALNPQELTVATLERQRDIADSKISPREAYREFARLLEQPRHHNHIFTKQLTAKHFMDIVNDQAQATRSVARQLDNEAQSHYGSRNFHAAVQTSTTTIRLGNSSARGGTVIDALVGVAVEGIGVGSIEPQIANLSGDIARELTASLEEVDAAREPLDLLMRREEAFSDRMINWLYRLERIVLELAGGEMSANEVVRSAILRRDMMLRLLITELAVHAYHTQHGMYPQSLEDLLPDLLRRVPLDPFSGEPLQYRVTTKAL